MIKLSFSTSTPLEFRIMNLIFAETGFLGEATISMEMSTNSVSFTMFLG